MKKILLFTMLLTQVNLFGQAVPNGLFENWNTTPYNDPTGWTTGNTRDIQNFGTSSISKVTGYSGFAVRLQTMISGQDTSESYMINTSNPCSDPSSWTGGVPYSQQPTAITGYYRYSLPGNDTALIIVIFRKNGVHIGDNLIKIRGTGNQSVFTSFSFPVTCSGVPDSVIIAAASSNKISNTGVQNGSFLELDNLAFTGTTQAIPNGNFENWTPKSFDVPYSWEIWGGEENGVKLSTSSYSGSYAVRIETMNGNCSGTNPSGITTGHMTNNGPKGGRPYTNTMDTLCGYYKYTPMGGDSASIYVTLSVNGVPMGGNNKWLTAAANYTYFELPFQSGTTPDTIRIDAQSSSWPVNAANTGSVLYLDNLYLKTQPLGIPYYESAAVLALYPNPVKDQLQLTCGNAISGSSLITIYNALGENVMVKSVSGKQSILDVQSLPAGMYWLQLKNQEQVITKKFIKE